MEDITKTGPVPLKGLKGIGEQSAQPNQKLIDLGKFVDGISSAVKSGRATEMFLPKNDVQNIGNMIQGHSQYDDQIQSMSDIENINDFRGKAQPAIDQIANGLGKMGVLAATTFANSFIVPTIGLGTGIYNAATAEDGKGWQSFAQGFWDNGGTKAMNSINEKSEEVLKNYYTDYEQSAPWYDNVFTANFIGDKMLKNMGFTIGSIGAAAITGGFVNPLVSGLGKVGQYGARALTTAVSTMAEASVEGLNAANDVFKVNSANINDYYKGKETELQQKYSQAYNDIEASKDDSFYTTNTDKGMSGISGKQLKRQQLAQQYNDEYNGLQQQKDMAIAKATEDRINTGNFTFALNNLLLGVTNNIQFARELGGGFTNAARGKALQAISKSTGEQLTGKAAIATAMRSGDMAVKGLTGFGKTVAKKAALNMASEGFEEGAQTVISDTPKIKYSADMNSFMGAKINPESGRETDGFLNAASEAIYQNFSSPESTGWQDVFLGGISGLLGVPFLKKGKNGGIRPTWTGGLKEAYDETKTEFKPNAYVDQLNTIVADPNFVSRYEGLVRRNTYQAGMDKAAEEGNKFDYKNYEHSQFVSDAIMFNKVGQIDAFNAYLDSFSDVSDADIKELKENTELKDSKGKTLYENKSSEEIKEAIQTRAKENKELFKTVTDTYDKLQVAYGDKLSPENLEELTWQTVTNTNLVKRMDNILSNVTIQLGSMASTQQVDTNTEYKIPDSEETLTMSQLLTDSKQFQKGLKNTKFRQDMDEILQKSGNTVAMIELKQDIQDLGKITSLQKNIQGRIAMAMKDPNTLTKKTAEIRSEAIVAHTNTVVKDMLPKITDETTDAEFIDYLDEIDDEDVKFNVVTNLQKSENEHTKVLATNYIESNEIRQDMSKLLKTNSLKLDEEGLEIAKNIFGLSSIMARSKKDFLEYHTERKNQYIQKIQDSTDIDQVRKDELILKINTVVDQVLKVKTKAEQSRVSNVPDPNVQGKPSLLNQPDQSDYDKSASVDQSEIDWGSVPAITTKPAPKPVSNQTVTPTTISTQSNPVANTPVVIESVGPDAPIIGAPPAPKTKGFGLIRNAKTSLEDVDFEGDEKEPVIKSIPIVKSEAKNLIAKLPSVLEEAYPELLELANREESLDVVANWMLSDKNLIRAMSEPITDESTIDEKNTVKLASFIYDMTHPEISTDSTGVTNVTETAFSQRGTFRSFVETKYDINKLKDPNIRKTQKRTESIIVDALEALNAYDFVDMGYLGILNNKAEDGFKNTKDPESKLKIHHIMPSKDSPLGNNILLAVEITKAMAYYDIPSTAFRPVVIDGKSYQIVGVLHYNSNDPVAKEAYEIKLAKLLKDREASQSTEDYTVTDSYSYIKEMHSGRFVKSTDEQGVSFKPLGQITTETPKLGIYYDGALGLVTPSLSDQEVIVPLNSHNTNSRSGSLFVMTRGADGKYYAKALQVATFTPDDYNLQQNLETPLMQDLKGAIMELLDTTSTITQRAKAKLAVGSILFFPKNGVQLHFNGNTITITDNKNINLTYKINPDKSLEEQALEFMTLLHNRNLGLRFQIKRSDLSHNYYVDKLIASNILYTDLAQLHNANASFDLTIDNKIDTPVVKVQIQQEQKTGLASTKLDYTPITPPYKYLDMYINENGEVIKSGKVVTYDDLSDPMQHKKDVEIMTIIGNIVQSKQNPAAVINRLNYHQIQLLNGQKIVLVNQSGTLVYRIATSKNIDTLKEYIENIKREEAMKELKELEAQQNTSGLNQLTKEQKIADIERRRQEELSTQSKKPEGIIETFQAVDNKENKIFIKGVTQSNGSILIYAYYYNEDGTINSKPYSITDMSTMDYVPQSIKQFIELYLGTKSQEIKISNQEDPFIKQFANTKINEQYDAELEALEEQQVEQPVIPEDLIEPIENTNTTINETFNADAINKVNQLLDSKDLYTFDEILYEGGNFDRAEAIMGELGITDLDVFKQYLKDKGALVEGTMTNEDYNTMLDNLKDCKK